MNNRRRFVRAEGIGSAVVLADEQYLGSFLLKNLSAGGALLLGDTRLTPGREVRLLLHARGVHLMSIRATVVRQDDGRDRAFAVRFEGLRPTQQDQLQSIVLGELERQHGS